MARVKHRTRTGLLTWRYVASWPTREGKAGRATFSVDLYGEKQARDLAIEARRRGLEKLFG